MQRKGRASVRVCDMGVHVDNARCDQKSGDIDLALPCLLGQIWRYCFDLAIINANISDAVEIVGRINDMAAFKQDWSSEKAHVYFPSFCSERCNNAVAKNSYDAALSGTSTTCTVKRAGTPLSGKFSEK